MKNLCEEDEIDVFFKSVSMTAKKIPKQAIKEAKLKTLTLTTEITSQLIQYFSINIVTRVFAVQLW